MRRAFTLSLLAAAVAAPLWSGAPALAQTAPPPPPQAQVVPAPPPPVAHGRAWVWQPGYWRWTPRGYRWVAGRYVHPPRGQTVWVPGRWVLVRGRYVWHPGRWRR